MSIDTKESVPPSMLGKQIPRSKLRVERPTVTSLPPSCPPRISKQPHSSPHTFPALALLQAGPKTHIIGESNVNTHSRTGTHILKYICCHRFGYVQAVPPPFPLPFPRSRTSPLACSCCQLSHHPLSTRSQGSNHRRQSMHASRIT